MDFDKAAAGSENNQIEATASVVVALANTIASSIAGECGTVKLASVFKEVAKDPNICGFSEVVNFTCLAMARGRNWSETLESIIERTDKNAFYLSVMLQRLMNILRYEILLGRDRDAMKRLVALIQAKRSFSKKMPGAKAVRRMIDILEEDNYFPESN